MSRAMPVALATLAAVGLLVGSAIAISDVSGDGSAEILRLAHEHSSSVTLSTVLEIAGFILLVAPLVYLFRADQARSAQVRGQFIGGLGRQELKEPQMVVFINKGREDGVAPGDLFEVRRHAIGKFGRDRKRIVVREHDVGASRAGNSAVIGFGE